MAIGSVYRCRHGGGRDRETPKLPWHTAGGKGRLSNQGRNRKTVGSAHAARRLATLWCVGIGITE